MRLRAEVRGSRIVSIGIGATRLRRSQSVTPPRRRSGLAPVPRPALGASTFALTPPPATAPRPRSGDHGPRPGAASPSRDGVPASPWSRPPRLRIGIAPVPRSSPATAFWPLPRRRAPFWGPRPSTEARPSVLGGFPAAMPRPTPPWGPPPLPWRRAPALCPALGVRDAKNRLFWSLAVKTDGFSRSRKWEMDIFVGCSRMGFPIAQIIACFGLEAAKNRQF